jgi:hypothetical protein
VHDCWASARVSERVHCIVFGSFLQAEIEISVASDLCLELTVLLQDYVEKIETVTELTEPPLSDFSYKVLQGKHLPIREGVKNRVVKFAAFPQN